MPRLIANGVGIEYEVHGQGQPILLVMGLAGQLVDWPDGFVDLFVAEGYQVIRFDNRDIGLSDQMKWSAPGPLQLLRSLITRRRPPGVDYTVTDMAADAAGLLDGLGIESAHIVGISMGGMIAQELAIGHPERVRSLCSIMSNTGDRRNGRIATPLLVKLARRKPPTKETAVDQSVELFDLIAGPHFDREEHRKMAIRSVERSFAPAGVARQTAAIAASRNRTEPLATVAAPTLVIHGLADLLVLPSGGVATTKAIPGARLLALPDMGHDLPRPRWNEIRDAILANIRRASTEAPQ